MLLSASRLQRSTFLRSLVRVASSIDAANLQKRGAKVFKFKLGSASLTITVAPLQWTCFWGFGSVVFMIRPHSQWWGIRFLAALSQHTFCMVFCLAEERGKPWPRRYALYRLRLQRSPTLRSRLLRRIRPILAGCSVRVLEHRQDHPRQPPLSLRTGLVLELGQRPSPARSRVRSKHQASRAQRPASVDEPRVPLTGIGTRQSASS